jgi:DNA-binding winged helix-turn-helix (wHTH) protein/Tol biopolymer transport system component
VDVADVPRRPVLAFGPFTFDPNRRLLSRDGQEVALPPRVLSVLELLLQQAGEVVSRQTLIETIWKDAFVTDTSLAEAVSALRQVLGDDSQAPTYIQTLHRRGYRFVAPVTSDAASSVPAPRKQTADADTTRRVSPSIAWELVPWSAAVICAVVAIAAVWQFARRGPAPGAPAAHFLVAPATGAAFDGAAPAFAFSPDGALIAWSACDATGCQLYARAIDRIDAVPLPGTRGAKAPFFSPDGQWLGFFAGGRLMKVALAGGAPVAIADAPTPLGATWIGREIIFAGAPSGGLMRVPEGGGDARPATMPAEAAGEVRHAWPSVVPGTKALIFTIDTTPSLDPRGTTGLLAVLSLDAIGESTRASSGPPRWRTLLSGVTIAHGAAPDLIVFGRDAELHAIAFDPARLVTAGPPKALVTDVATARGRAQFALSATGALVHAIGPTSSGYEVSLRSSDPSAGAAATWTLRDAALSPDGTRVTGVNLDGTRAEVWISDVRRGASTRVTHSGLAASPAWSADGRVVYFASRNDGPFEIWSRDADGAGKPARRFSAGRHALPLSASPDGRMLAFLQTADATRADIWMLPLDGHPARPLVQSPFDETAASFSPDSSMIAFQSAETGRWEIYVQRIGDGRRIVVSTNGGERPVWTREGLYYQSDNAIIRASIGANEDGPRVDATAAAPIGDADRLAVENGALLQGVAPDGRALLVRPAGFGARASQPSRAVVSLDWLREARVRLGPPEVRLPR